MGCHVQNIDLQEAYQSVKDYTYALLYMISQRILCKTEELPMIDWEECQEARFFSEEKELHIFEDEEGMRAIIVYDTDQEDIMVKEYELDNMFVSLGKTVLVQEYLAYDDSGQVSVELTRLKGIR
jgi:hypothetical protein